MTKEEFKFDYCISEQMAERLDRMVEQEIQQAISEHEAGKKVIKAKALRKKGTDVFYEDNDNFTLTISRFPDLWHPDNDLKSVKLLYPHFPKDAEIIDIEITYQEGRKT